MGAEKWQHLNRWPLPNTDYTQYYLDADGKLSTSKAAAPGNDTIPLLPASSPCSRMTAQWTAGLTSSPCDTDNRTWEATGLTYTSAPLAKDTEVTGLIKADVWAELTSAKDATLVAVLSDVDPDSGASNQISAGFLLASQRAVDHSKETTTKSGLVIRPYHPFTRASQEAVIPNEAYKYEIEIYPTSQLFKKGHQLRLTIGTADTPATSTKVTDLVNETGTITLLHGPGYPSSVQLPVVGPEQAVMGAKAKSKKAKAKKRHAKRRHAKTRKHRKHRKHASHRRHSRR